MHPRILLVLVVAAQLACCDAAPTETLSKLARVSEEHDVVHSFPTAQTDGTRLLRSLKTSLQDDVDPDAEERVIGNVGKADDVVESMVDDIPSLVAMFKNWRGLTVEEIFKTPAGLALIEKAPNKQFMRVFNLYGEYNLLGKKAFIAKLERMKQKAHAGTRL
jgi:hypothetical protein